MCHGSQKTDLMVKNIIFWVKIWRQGFNLMQCVGWLHDPFLLSIIEDFQGNSIPLSIPKLTGCMLHISLLSDKAS